MANILENLDYSRLRATADGLSDTAKQASAYAGKRSTRNNHRIAAMAHVNAMRSHYKAHEVSQDKEKEYHKNQVSFHQRRSDEHFSQTMR